MGQCLEYSDADPGMLTLCFFLALVITLVFVFKSYRVSVTTNPHETKLKIMADFLQMLYLMSSGSSILTFFVCDLAMLDSDVIVPVFDFHCPLPLKPIFKPFTRIFVIALSLGQVILAVLLTKGIAVCNKSNFRLHSLVALLTRTLVDLAFYACPLLFSVALGYWTCKDIDVRVVLASSPTVACWSSEHTAVLAVMSAFSVLLLFIAPICMLVTMHRLEDTRGRAKN